MLGSAVFSGLKPGRKALKAKKLKEQVVVAAAPSPKKEILVLPTVPVPTVELGHDVCIKGLAKSTTESELQTYLETVGPVLSVALVKDKKQRSRGFAFVRFKNSADAKKCVKKSLSLAEQQLSCTMAHSFEAKPTPPPPPTKTAEELAVEEQERRDAKKAKRRARIAKKYQTKQNAILVGGLKRDVSEEKLAEYFGTYGAILKVHVVRDDNQRSRGYAFVVFSNEKDPAAAEKAVTASISKPHHIAGAPVTCKLADRREDTPMAAKKNTQKGLANKEAEGEPTKQQIHPQQHKKRRQTDTDLPPHKKHNSSRT